MINFCVFEDDGYKQLSPLTDIRPACDLLLGTRTLFEKVISYYDYGNVTIHCRDYLKKVVSEYYPNYAVNNINIGAPCFFINGRLILNDYLVDLFSKINQKNNYLFTSGDHVVSVYLRGELLQKMIHLLKGTPSSKEMIDLLRKNCITKDLNNVEMVTNIWDIVVKNPSWVEHDFKRLNKFGIIKANLKPFTSIYNEYNVFLDESSHIEDFVVINAEKGPVYIDKHVRINAHTRIEGPVYVGQHSQILGGKIKNSTIGPYCKIAGEVSDSVFQGFSNKAHDGFVGHSSVGRWVNIGANTNVSNLKNNYGNVKLVYKGNPLSTNLQFLGAIIGDHVKISIGTHINTGTIIHTGAVILDKFIEQKEVNLFSWGPSQNKICDIEKFISTAKIVYERRQQRLSDSMQELFSFLYSKVVSNESK